MFIYILFYSPGWNSPIQFIYLTHLRVAHTNYNCNHTPVYLIFHWPERGFWFLKKCTTTIVFIFWRRFQNGLIRLSTGSLACFATKTSFAIIARYHPWLTKNRNFFFEKFFLAQTVHFNVFRRESWKPHFWKKISPKSIFFQPRVVPCYNGETCFCSGTR